MTYVKFFIEFLALLWLVRSSTDLILRMYSELFPHSRCKEITQSRCMSRPTCFLL